MCFSDIWYVKASKIDVGIAKVEFIFQISNRYLEKLTLLIVLFIFVYLSTMKPSPLIIIPARGGSKGIPHKNIKSFAGKPLIFYSVEVARKIVPDSHILLSTDDNEIADIVRTTGLRVDYMRPAELASDTASTRDVVLHAMEWADRTGLEYDRVVLLQPTSPLRIAEDVRNALNVYDCAPMDMAVTVTESAANPYYDCFEVNPDGILKISKGSGEFTRRQDAPKAWQYNGAVYVINPASIRKYSFGEMPRKFPVPMPRERSVDIDTPLDWIIAETIKNAEK